MRLLHLNRNSDRLGILASILCLMHCLVTPFLFIARTGLIISEETTALALGNYSFTDTNGIETKVAYAFGHSKQSSRELKINVHHSSLPFNVAKRI